MSSTDNLVQEVPSEQGCYPTAYRGSTMAYNNYNLSSGLPVNAMYVI